MTTLALINKETNICENVTLDSRSASEIQIEGYLVVSLHEVCVDGGIGYVWDGEKLNPPPPVLYEPAENQPNTSGMQTL